ncbi:MAG: hypothetical protein MUF58_02970 [Arcicella sp.]|jgi:hypothetical protein|nr:hypothetical protein [Arcicella sp.]
MNRDKFYPNEGREREGFKKYNFNDTISKEVLKVLNLPINNKNLLEINNYSVYMTFLKKDSVFTFSNTMNNVLNIGIRFLSHETLKGKYRAFCKIDKERLFHSIKLWNEKNERSEYDLPKYWGKFKFIENPTIKSDTIHFEIY